MTDAMLQPPPSRLDLLQATLDAMDEGMIVRDAQRNVVIANKRAVELLDLPEHLLAPGTSLQKMIAHLATIGEFTDWGINWAEKLERVILDGQPALYERTRPNGKIILIRASSFGDDNRMITFRDVTAERKATAALRQSEERYRGIVDSQAEAVCRWDPDGNMTYANEAYCKLKGMPRSNISGRKAFDEIHPEDRARLLESISTLGPDNPTVAVENRIVDTRGNIRWMMWTNSVILDERRNILEYQSAGHETTERVMAEEAAREAERQLRLVIDELPVCIAYIRADGRYDLVNKTYEKWFDLSRDEIIGKTAAEVIGEDALATLQPQIDIALSGRASTFEGSVPYTTAGERYVQWSYVPNFSADGTVHGFYSVVTDLSDKVRADRALRESQERFRRLVETSPDIIMVHSEGRILYVNSAGVRQIHKSGTGDLVGRNIREFIRPAQLERVGIIGSEEKSDGPKTFQEVTLRRDDGTSFEVEVAGASVAFRGKPAVQLICRDITARKTAQAQLMQSSKLASLGEMAAGMAHELNQPLNVIRMAADNSLFMIDEDGETDIDIHRRQFEVIAEQSVRMAAIIDHMREFARIDDENAEPVDPFKAVRRGAEFFTEPFRTDNIRLDVNLPDEEVEVLGHHILLEQLIVGLLQNACDAILEGRRQRGSETESRSGQIDISASVIRRDNLIAIRVTDNGGGVPGALIDQIFEPFFTTKPVGKGTGLGLYVGNEIVKRMDGVLTVENSPTGAVFTVELPIYDQPPASSQATAQ